MRRPFRWDKKYLYWGITAFCVVAAAILFWGIAKAAAAIGTNIATAAMVIVAPASLILILWPLPMDTILKGCMFIPGKS